jgi:hypothetical protein
MPDVSLMIQSGYTPRKEWIERHFRVELEEKKEENPEDEAVSYDPEKDQDLFGSIFGAEGEQAPQPAAENVDAAKEDLTAAANVMDEPEGATPEESQTDAIAEPDEDQEMNDLLGGMLGEEEDDDDEEEDDDDDEDEISDEELMETLGLGGDEEEEEPTKPFGNQSISEDEAVEMDK